MSRRNPAACSWAPCFSSQLIWLIIFSRTTHKARISASACAASRSPNTEKVSHLPVKNVGQLPTFLRKSHPTLSKSSPSRSALLLVLPHRNRPPVANPAIHSGTCGLRQRGQLVVGGRQGRGTRSGPNTRRRSHRAADGGDSIVTLPFDVAYEVRALKFKSNYAEPERNSILRLVRDGGVRRLAMRTAAPRSRRPVHVRRRWGVEPWRRRTRLLPVWSPPR